MRKVLLNPTNAGILAVSTAEDRGHRVEQGPAAWPSIWEPEGLTQDEAEATFRQAQQILADPTRRNGYHCGERRHLMTGVAECAYCGGRVQGGSWGAGRPTYMCGLDRRHFSRALPPVDEYVEHVVITKLSAPRARRLLVDHHAPYMRRLSAERSRLIRQQAEDAVDDELTRAQLHARTAKANARIREIDAAMTHPLRSAALAELIEADDPRRVWDGLTLARKQAALTALGRWIIGKGRIGRTPRSARTTDAANLQLIPHDVAAFR